MRKIFNINEIFRFKYNSLSDFIYKLLVKKSIPHEKNLKHQSRIILDTSLIENPSTHGKALNINEILNFKHNSLVYFIWIPSWKPYQN